MPALARSTIQRVALPGSRRYPVPGTVDTGRVDPDAPVDVTVVPKPARPAVLRGSDAEKPADAVRAPRSASR